MKNELDRRTLLKAGAFAALPESMFSAPGNVVHEISEPGADPDAKPEHTIKFAVIGVDHNHILGITAAVQRGGGQLVSVYGTYEKGMADFRARFGDVKLAKSEEEILNDPSIQLVCSAAIPDLRAPLGIKVMHHGKDFLSDKPGMVSLEQLAEVRHAIKETGKTYAILYSERLEVKAAIKAGELVKAGEIGKVVQTVNLAPHRVSPASRPDWFWDTGRYGGILCDIGSHQADQFLFYTGSTTAQVTASQVANANHPNHPKFEDFGDMMLHGNGGAGYVRVDWFTPDGLETWGDGRLFILGTEGYIELRKYTDIAGRKGGNHLFVVNKQQPRYVDCSKVALPFGPQFVADIVNRTHVAQDQEQALLTAEIVIKAQMNAKQLKFQSS